MGYPLAAGALARVRERRVAKDASAEPTVAVVVAAYNEEAVIERRLENLLALDDPADRFQIVVASDASTDRTNELVAAVAARESRVRLLECPRGGKVAAQDRAVRETASDVVAFSDANATWAPDALRRLVTNLADPDVAYVCGALRLADAEGNNREGLYWRYELWLREQESRLGSITGGNGAIYALDRADYVEVDPRWGHDLSLPYRMVQNGPPRGVRAGGARVRAAHTLERGRVPHARCACSSTAWEITLRGSMLKRLPPVYLAEVVSHRLLRYGQRRSSTSCCSPRASPSTTDGWAYGIVLARPGGVDRRRGRRTRPDRAVLRATSPGPPFRPCGTTSGAAFPPPGTAAATR